MMGTGVARDQERMSVWEANGALPAVADSGVAHEGAGEEASHPAGEAGGGARQGAARQPEETAQPRARAGGVPEPGRERVMQYSSSGRRMNLNI
ncbi:jg25913 [Pararge aegeria aegeria]|uniref:Jg25913 protein n=1 Tax=Pararge aegeria aegeria TaxID=348720 RepID=A0A8S4QNU0_9NEOP|nr:jg25913 [Pararge aegeria aegeria]